MILARKRFGQHFLHDRGVLDRIVGELAPQPDQALLEIGPGRVLTGLMRKIDRSVTAVNVSTMDSIPAVLSAIMATV